MPRRKNAPLMFVDWLWDLLPLQQKKQPPQCAKTKRPQSILVNKTKSSRQQRYDAMVEQMKAAHNIRIRKWRSNTTGCAWQVIYEDGQVNQWIESPYPRGPVSCAIFLHEVGHHAIGFTRYKPRCLEEYKAWEWSLNTMTQLGFNISPSVQKRVESSLRYAVAKAQRRGLKHVPDELVKYAD